MVRSGHVARSDVNWRSDGRRQNQIIRIANYATLRPAPTAAVGISREPARTLDAMTISRNPGMARSKTVFAMAFALALGVSLSLPAQAQWKWRDKQGHTLYSDLPPPPGVSEQDILQRPPGSNARRAAPAAAAATASAPSPAASAVAAPLLAPKASEPELEARRKKVEQDLADKKKADDAKLAVAKAENCTRAKAYQRTLDSGIRIARTNAKGEREILDDTARAAEAKTTKDAVASECK